MRGHRALFSSASPNWSTPRKFYDSLHSEFHFTLDPCALGAEGGLYGTMDGLHMDWSGHRVFCNPPYGPGIVEWVQKWAEPDLVVYLLPARTDTRWFHNIVLRHASEIRFIKGRLKFGERSTPATFPSMAVVFRGATE